MRIQSSLLVPNIHQFSSTGICAFLRAVHGWSIRPGGSLLTQGPLCAQTYSATARHEHGAKRNANGTALTNPDSYLRFNMLPLNYTINRKSAHRHYGDGRCSQLRSHYSEHLPALFFLVSLLSFIICSKCFCLLNIKYSHGI